MIRKFYYLENNGIEGGYFKHVLSIDICPKNSDCSLRTTNLPKDDSDSDLQMNP